MKGELSGSEDLVIDGQVEGTVNLRQHLLTIGPSAKISAEISAKAVVVLGHARGNITATERIEIRESGWVDGDVSAPYCRWLKLHGCVRLDSASDYRLLYRFRAGPQAATAPSSRSWVRRGQPLVWDRVRPFHLCRTPRVSTKS
jgi:hypothetical protein